MGIDYINSADIFLKMPYSWYNQKINQLEIYDFTPTYLHYLELTPTQHFNDRKLVNKKMQFENLHTDILVVYECGNYFLINGHHTAIAQIKKGVQYLWVKLYKMSDTMLIKTNYENCLQIR